MTILKRIGLTIIYLSCMGTAIYAYGFLFIDSFMSGSAFKQKIAQDYVNMFLHLFGGATCLFLSPLAMTSYIRTNFLSIHKLVGRVYCISVLMGATGGFMLSFNATGGLVSQVGFGLLAPLWVYSTLKGYIYIRKKELELHREWMIRSFAITLAAVTLRIELSSLLAYTDLPFEEVYSLTSWLCWVPNLIIAEWFIFTKKKTRSNQIKHAEVVRV